MNDTPESAPRVAVAARYARQALFSGIGERGQAALAEARVAIVGLGALGAASADILARAGVGALRLIDRDVLELTNLQRQVLYDERDLEAGLPKAQAALRRLGDVNSEISLEAHAVDLVPANARGLLGDVDLVIDGTDNFETRLLINDVCLAQGLPWVYCGVIGASVHSFNIRPGQPPCFRCYLGEVPPPGSVETCDTAGVLGPTVLVGVGLATMEALKMLAGQAESCARGLRVLDLWSGSFRSFELASDPGCRACQGHYDFLAGAAAPAARLCGRNAVQLAPRDGQRVDLRSLAKRLSPLGTVTANPFLLRFEPSEWPEGELTVFPDGRIIIKGTEDFARARVLGARYLGA